MDMTKGRDIEIGPKHEPLPHLLIDGTRVALMLGDHALYAIDPQAGHLTHEVAIGHANALLLEHVAQQLNVVAQAMTALLQLAQTNQGAASADPKAMVGDIMGEVLNAMKGAGLTPPGHGG